MPQDNQLSTYFLLFQGTHLIRTANIIDFVYSLYINTLGDVEGHFCNEQMNYNYDKKFYEKVAFDNERDLTSFITLWTEGKDKDLKSAIKQC